MSGELALHVFRSINIKHITVFISHFYEYSYSKYTPMNEHSQGGERSMNELINRNGITAVLVWARTEEADGEEVVGVHEGLVVLESAAGARAEELVQAPQELGPALRPRHAEHGVCVLVARARRPSALRTQLCVHILTFTCTRT